MTDGSCPASPDVSSERDTSRARRNFCSPRPQNLNLFLTGEWGVRNANEVTLESSAVFPGRLPRPCWGWVSRRDGHKYFLRVFFFFRMTQKYIL